MQDWPEKEALLAAVAEHLMNDVRPKIADARLSFRVLIAANLARTACAELEREDADDAAELTRLRALLPDVATDAGDDRPARRRAIRTLRAALAQTLRAGALDEPTLARVRDHLRETLKAQLQVNNPLFDLSPEIEP